MALSFNKFVCRSFSDQIHEKLNNHIEKHGKNLKLRLRYIKYLNTVQLKNWEIKFTKVYHTENNLLLFTVVVNAYLLVFEEAHLISDYEYTNFWFIFDCGCNIDDNISNFKIKNIQPYEKRNLNYIQLSDSLVPYIKKEQLDDIAYIYLKKYAPEVLLSPQKLDVNLFAEKLGLTIQSGKHINKNIMGRIYFKETKSIHQDNRINVIPGKTIVINENNPYIKYKGCKSYTIAHECVHWLLHRNIFKLENILRKNNKMYINCITNGSAEADIDNINWMEWQANSLAPRLLMPAEQFKVKVNQLIEHYKLINNTADCLDYYEQLISELSVFYDVSPVSVKIRLCETGFDFVLGINNIINNKKVIAHGFKKGFLKSNQTFAVNIRDAYLFAFFNKDKMNIQNYVYIDSFLCLNLSKYIIKENNIIKITEYARRNMHECCIKFELELPNIKGNHFYSPIIYFLNRKIRKGKEPKIKFDTTNITELNDENKKEFIETLDIQFKLLNSLNNDIAHNFKECKKYAGVTNQVVADESGLTLRTIERISSGRRVEKYTIIRICLAMHLPPPVTYHFLDITNNKLNTNVEEDRWYSFIISHCYLQSVEVIITKLNQLKINTF